MAAKRLQSIGIMLLAVSLSAVVVLAILLHAAPQNQRDVIASPPNDTDGGVGGAIMYSLRVKLDRSGSDITKMTATVQPQTDGVYFQTFDLREGDSVTLDCSHVAQSPAELVPGFEDLTVSWIGSVGDESVPDPIPVYKLDSTARRFASASVSAEEAQELAPGFATDELPYPRNMYVVADVLAVDESANALTVRVVNHRQALDEAGIVAATDVAASPWADIPAGTERTVYFPDDFKAPAAGDRVLLYWIEDVPSDQTAPQRAIAWYPLEDAAEIMPAT